MFADVNGIRLYYEKSGCGQPIVLSHCNSMSHTIFKKAVKVLEKKFTVYNVDTRDHGKSTKVGTLHYEDMAEDMFQFITKLKIEKPIFYGFSDGGITGILLASLHPDLLSKLIISGASLSPESTKALPMAFFKLWSHVDSSDKMQIMMREPNITDDILKAITVPTFVTCGSHDVIKESHSRHIAETIPDATLKIFEGEGHSGYIMNSRKIADYILDVTK